MQQGLPDQVDCRRLAADEVRLERVYELRDLPRLQDLLADPGGFVRASFDFGGAGAVVSVESLPELVCQRCMQGFAYPVAHRSAVEFAASESVLPADPENEIFVVQDGLLSLRELAEEELILALPVIAACANPQSCGNAPALSDHSAAKNVERATRPFAGLQDLLKKT